MATTLADLLETYPDDDDPKLQEIIASKKEFFGPEYVPKKFGELKPHQLNVIRWAGKQNGPKSISIMWGTGEGKTQILISLLIEYIHTMMNGDQKVYKRALVVVKKSILAQWLKEFAKWPQFTTVKLRKNGGADYTIKGYHHALSDSTKKIVMLVSIDRFASILAAKTPDQIRVDHSHDIFVGDEAHAFLRTEKSSQEFDQEFEAQRPEIARMKKQGKLPKAEMEVDLGDNEALLKEAAELKEADLEKPILKTDPNYEAKITFIQMMRLKKYARFLLQITLTATPMYNSVLELPSVLNFTQPEDKQINMSDYQLALQNGIGAVKDYLRPLLNGHVSALFARSDLAPVIDEGRTFERMIEDEVVMSKIKVVGIPMLPEQEAVYLSIREKKGGGDNGEKKEKFYTKSRQALNFVYIDPQDKSRNSHAGFDYFFDPVDPKNSLDGFVAMDPSPYLTTTEKNVIKEAKKKAKKDGKKYKRDKRNLGPIRFEFRFEDELFAGCKPRNPNLQHFEPLDQQRLAVIKRMSAKYAWVIDHVHNNFLYPGEGEMAFYYHPWIKNGGCILLGMCFEAMGYERFYGETDKASTLSDKPRYALMTGKPGSTSARNRNIQEVANDPLNLYGQKLMIVIASDVSSVGITFLNGRKFIYGGPAFHLITQPQGRLVRTNSHRAFPDQKRQRYVRSFLLAAELSNGTQTIDHQIWFDDVQKKEEEIAPVKAVVAETSFDAGLNNPIIRREIEKKTGGKKDLSTYHLHWASDEYREIELRIRKAFLVKNDWTRHEFFALFGNFHDISTIVWCLADLLSKKTIIIDRFGIPRMLMESQEVYFICPFFHENRTSEDYGKVLRAKFPTTFNTIAKKVVSTTLNETDGQSLEQFKTDWFDTHNINNSTMRIIKLEEALCGKIANREIAQFILTYFDFLWFEVNGTIFHYLEEMSKKGNEGAHSANRQAIESVKHQIIIKIKGPNDPGFRIANSSETSAAAKVIDQSWNNRLNYVVANMKASYVVIHNISSDGEIRIFLIDKKLTKNDGKGDRRGNKGKKAKLFKKEELLDLLWEKRITNTLDSTDDRDAFNNDWLGDRNDTRTLDKMILALKNYAEKNNLLIKK